MNGIFKKAISFISLVLMIIAADRVLTYLLEPMSRADFFRHAHSETESYAEYTVNLE